MPAYPTTTNASTNDERHRLTFRWKTKETCQNLAENSAEWLTTFLGILNDIFSDRDGSFYRWESADLSQSCPVSQLNIQELREYISPKIASLDTISTFVFGLRFRFADRTPLRWRNCTRTKQTLAEHGISLNLSNLNLWDGS